MRKTSLILALAACAMLGAAVSGADATTTPATQSDLPAPALKTLQQNADTKEFAKITQSSTADGKTVYAATVTKDGKQSVVTVAADGTLISVVDAK